MKYFILIMLMQDPAGNWHALRTAVYSASPTCEAQGASLVKLIGKANYFCVPADLPN
jgi:hypothetical protein